jgi:hypothetical protein
MYKKTTNQKKKKKEKKKIMMDGKKINMSIYLYIQEKQKTVA